MKHEKKIFLSIQEQYFLFPEILLAYRLVLYGCCVMMMMVGWCRLKVRCFVAINFVSHFSFLINSFGTKPKSISIIPSTLHIRTIYHLYPIGKLESTSFTNLFLMNAKRPTYILRSNFQQHIRYNGNGRFLLS